MKTLDSLRETFDGELKSWKSEMEVLSLLYKNIFKYPPPLTRTHAHTPQYEKDMVDSIAKSLKQ